jgi:hypothetical protein
MTNDKRYSLRLALEAAGCAVAGYDRTGFQVQVKRGKFSDCQEAAARLGLKLREGSLNYFPLGSDAPPMEFRHHAGRYTQANGFPDPGFWLFATYDADEPLCEETPQPPARAREIDRGVIAYPDGTFRCNI